MGLSLLSPRMVIHSSLPWTFMNFASLMPFAESIRTVSAIRCCHTARSESAATITNTMRKASASNTLRTIFISCAVPLTLCCKATFDACRLDVPAALQVHGGLTRECSSHICSISTLAGAFTFRLLADLADFGADREWPRCGGQFWSATGSPGPIVALGQAELIPSGRDLGSRFNMPQLCGLGWMAPCQCPCTPKHLVDNWLRRGSSVSRQRSD